jgi:hypothetical protein
LIVNMLGVRQPGQIPKSTARRRGLLLRAEGSGEFVTAKGGSPMTWWADGPLVVMRLGHEVRRPDAFSTAQTATGPGGVRPSLTDFPRRLLHFGNILPHSNTNQHNPAVLSKFSEEFSDASDGFVI